MLHVRFSRIGAGLIGLGLATLATAPVAAMQFRSLVVQSSVVCKPNCPTIIVADGEINLESPRAFIAFLQGHLRNPNPRNVVLMHSPGGNVAGSLMLGTVWRKLGTTVIIARPSGGGGGGLFGGGSGTADGLSSASCASACVFALMGARKRHVPALSRVGVHQMHTIQFERDIAENGRVTEKLTASRRGEDVLRAYVKSMGIDPGIVSLSQSVPPHAIHVLSQKELTRYRIQTR